MTGIYLVVGNELSVGRLRPCQIVCENISEMSANHILISCRGGKEYLSMIGRNGGYLNGKFLSRGEVADLCFGDEIELFGIRILWLYKYVVVDYEDEITVNLDVYDEGKYDEIVQEEAISVIENKADETSDSMMKRPYFTKVPRPIYSIDDDVIELDAPPQKQMSLEQPVFMTIGPALSMALPMIIGFLVSRMASKGNGIVSSAFMYTGIVTAICSSFLGVTFAIMNMKNRKKYSKMYEEKRRESYIEYVRQSEGRIRERYNRNISTLRMMYPDISELIGGNVNRFLLWNRSKTDSDYLTVRLGSGDASFEMNISIPKDKFSVDEDELKHLPQKLKEQYSILRDVPIVVDILPHTHIGIISEMKGAREEVFYEIIACLAASVSPDEIKFVCIFENEEMYKDTALAVRFLPHLSHDNNTLISLGKLKKTKSDIINNFLEEDIYENIIIFTDCYEKTSKRIFLNDKCHVFVIDDKFEKLPSECRFIIQKDSSFSGYIHMTNNKFIRKNIHFDKIESDVLYRFSRQLQGIKIEEKKGKYNMPERLSFYSLFGSVVKNENIIKYWNTNSTKNSILAPIGISEDGEIISIDFHEKSMGPHGLIAGMTGSGKSEILQTIILSLAVLYSPKEVGFFLIDYKGGGMASLFENVPHVLGSISNLSGGLIKRAMASVKGENERRQRIFAIAQVNNIYEYNELYKCGRVTEPLPHIFIIIDEFAELKREEPEFMSGLISVARVGRSLGIHLILATQKPSGVVDDNIFSNSRFRICLRVQDKSDSMEMLHKPDAASIIRPGQGILQVGNDEIYTLFQGAYTMDKSEEVTKDGRIFITDETGNEYEKSKETVSHNLRPQLKCVIDEIGKARKNCIIGDIHPLWLKPLYDYIPLFDERFRKRGDSNKKNNFVLTGTPYDICIGIYDDPICQRQGELIINVVNTGHHIILGTLQSGKSTLLSTISYALLNIAKDHLITMYFIDYSTGLLKAYKDSLICGGYISEENEEDIEKLFILIEKEIALRRAALNGGNFRQYISSKVKNNDMPAIFIFIDGIGTFREKTGGIYDKRLEHILKNGESLGIFLIISANAISSQELPRRLADNFKVTIPLQLKDKYEYKEALNISNLDFVLPAQVRGRGLTIVSSRVVEFQSCVAIDEKDDFERFNLICEKVESINNELGNSYSMDRINQFIKRIPTIPMPLTFKAFIKEIESRDAINAEKIIDQDTETNTLSIRKIPVGFYSRSGEICYIPNEENLTIVIAGRYGSGKKNLVKVIEEILIYVNQKYKNNIETYVNQQQSKIENYVNQGGTFKSDILCSKIYIYDEKLPFDKLSEIKNEAGVDPYVIHLGGALDRQNFADYSYIPYSSQVTLLDAGKGIIRKTMRGYEHGEIVVPFVRGETK